MKKIIFVHGFGVRKDSRGMFTDIVDSLESAEFQSVLFDLTELGADGNIVVQDFSEQARRLTGVWERESDGSELFIVAHSQGCLITAIANPPNVTKTILLAPPTDNSNEQILEYFRSKSDSEVNLEGDSKLARSDGSFTVVPASYWIEKNALNTEELYQTYTTNHVTEVVRATEDEVISNGGMEAAFKDIQIHDIAANHNFDEGSRLKLITLLKELLG